MNVTKLNTNYCLTDLTHDEMEIILDGIVALKNNHLPAAPEFAESLKTCVAMVNQIEAELIS